MHEMTYHVFGTFRLPRPALAGHQYNLVLSCLLKLSVGVVSNPEQVGRLGGAHCEVLVVIMMLKAK